MSCSLIRNLSAVNKIFFIEILLNYFIVFFFSLLAFLQHFFTAFNFEFIRLFADSLFFFATDLSDCYSLVSFYEFIILYSYKFIYITSLINMTNSSFSLKQLAALEQRITEALQAILISTLLKMNFNFLSNSMSLSDSITNAENTRIICKIKMKSES